MDAARVSCSPKTRSEKATAFFHNNSGVSRSRSCLK